MKANVHQSHCILCSPKSCLDIDNNLLAELAGLNYPWVWMIRRPGSCRCRYRRGKRMCQRDTLFASAVLGPLPVPDFARLFSPDFHTTVSVPQACAPVRALLVGQLLGMFYSTSFPLAPARTILRRARILLQIILKIVPQLLAFRRRLPLLALDGRSTCTIA